MEVLKTPTPINIKARGNEPAILLLSGAGPMTTNELANFLIELSHFDIRFKDTKVTVESDMDHEIALWIRIPEPSAHDYISQLEFFLSRRIALYRWYLKLLDRDHPSICIKI